MWDFLRYTSKEQAFSFARAASITMEVGAGVGARAGTGAGTGAGARTGAGAGSWASRTVLRICCKSFSEYLGILLAVTGALATEGSVEGLAGWSDNLSPDLVGWAESRGVMEGAAKERSQRGRPRPRIEVILELISYKNTLLNGLADPLGMEKLEL